MKKGRTRILIFVVVMVTVLIGGRSNQMRFFAKMGNPYADTDVVNVDIVFEKKVIDESSLNEMIEKISIEALQGEKLDVRSVMGAYQINANILYAHLNTIRKIEGVESVRIVSFAYPMENNTEEETQQSETELSYETEVPVETESQIEDVSHVEGTTQAEHEEKDVNKEKTSSKKGWWIPFAVVGGVVGAGSYRRVKKENKKG